MYASSLCASSKAAVSVRDEDRGVSDDDDEGTDEKDEGFRGVIKERYSDFIVSEVDPSGRVIRLTNAPLPSEMTRKANADVEDGKKTRPPPGPVQGYKEIETLFGDAAIANAFRTYVDALTAARAKRIEERRGDRREDDDTARVGEEGKAKKEESREEGQRKEERTIRTEFLFPHVVEKSMRGRLHDVIREHFAGGGDDRIGALVSDTQVVEEKKRVRVYPKRMVREQENKRRRESDRSSSRGRGRRRKKQRRGRGRDDAGYDSRNNRARWTHGDKVYCHFTLYKENVDTMRAIHLISKTLRLNAKLFTYAGTKDKRGVTTQRVCAYRVTAERLAALNARERFPLKVGSFSYEKERLGLGCLSGNRFEIVLRDVRLVRPGKGDVRDVVSRAMASLATNGFVNYFGLQRFGRTSVSTAHVGAAILRKDWIGALRRILRPSCGDALDLSSRRALERSLNALPFKYGHHVERGLLRAMLATTKDEGEEETDGAFAARARDAIHEAIPQNMRKLYVHAFQSLLWNVATTERLQRYGLRAVEGDLVYEKTTTTTPEKEKVTRHERGTPRREPRLVTKEDETSRRYDVFDVVLPLPGYDVAYPTHDVDRARFDAILQRVGEGVCAADWGSKQVRSVYSLPGAYRHVMQQPADVTWELLTYDDYAADLSITDLQRLRRSETRGEEPTKENTATTTTTTSPPRLALRTAFTLRKSTYATMCLRELMKQSSHAGQHARSTLESRGDVVETR